MDPECKKSRVSRFILPGIFLMGLLLLGFPTQQAFADCGSEACPVCGDGVLCSNPALCNPVEECENNSDCAEGFHCESCQCVPNPICGDNDVNQPNEECDGTDNSECPELNGQRLCADDCMCQSPVCGNGVVAGDEDCDNGSQCADESDCTSGFNACMSAGTCDSANDEVIHTPACDACLRDACADDSICQPRFETTKDGVTCGPDCTQPVCGDGDVEGDEECDDENDNNEDGCKNDCTLPDCGDGIQSSTEECDASSGVDTCGTDKQCVNAGEPGECTCKLCPQCGNGELDPGEVCDDGNNQSGDGCENANNLENCGCENDCTLPVCGNGVVDSGFDANGVFHDEDCDAGASRSNNGLCTLDCKLAFCGDGHILNGPDQVITEVCDDGNNIDGDGCSADCQTCPDIACGNGRLDGLDECEIGEEDECGEGETCNTDTCRCEEDQEPPPVCGNNDTESGEECDGTDDEACDDDGCNSNCECNDDECPGEDDNDDRNRACTAEEEAGHKATICHIPPGNPENAHTLCVGDPAVDAHMSNHGDTLGPCAEECPAAGLTTGDGGGGDGTGTSSSASGGCSLIR